LAEDGVHEPVLVQGDEAVEQVVAVKALPAPAATGLHDATSVGPDVLLLQVVVT